MPDFERIMALLSLAIGSFQAEKFFMKMLTGPFHSILGVFLLAVFFGSFFPKEDSLQTFSLLFVGGLVHVLLDLMLWPWGGGYPIFFPLQGEKYSYGFHLIWPGNTTLPIFIGFPTSILLIYDRMKGGKQK